MKARNKRTGVECEVHWDMCDMGRKCSATDKPNSSDPQGFNLYNAVVDDYEFFVNGKWIDGLDYIKDPRRYYKDLEEEPEMPVWRRAFETVSESGKGNPKDIWFIDEEKGFLIKIPKGSHTARCLMLKDLESLPKEEGL